MATQLQITSVVGTPPYDIYVCDITNTYCFLVSGSTTITPIEIFDTPPPLDNVNELLLKIIDSKGCEKFIYLECNIINKLFEDGISFLFEDGIEYIFEG